MRSNSRRCVSIIAARGLMDSTNSYLSAFGEEQAAALVTIAAEQEGSLDPNREVKVQESGDATIRAACIIDHLDIGFRQASAPTFSNHIAPEHINRIVASPHRAGCAIAGMALPNLGRPRKAGVIGAIRVQA